MAVMDCETCAQTFGRVRRTHTRSSAFFELFALISCSRYALDSPATTLINSFPFSAWAMPSCERVAGTWLGSTAKITTSASWREVTLQPRDMANLPVFMCDEKREDRRSCDAELCTHAMYLEKDAGESGGASMRLFNMGVPRLP